MSSQSAPYAGLKARLSNPQLAMPASLLSILTGLLGSPAGQATVIEILTWLEGKLGIAPPTTGS